MESHCASKIDKLSADNELQGLLDYLSTPQDINIGSIQEVNRSAKAYNYFEPKGIVQNAWAVHYTYTEVFENICKVGFVHGCTDLDKLAYSDSKFDDKGNADVAKNDGWCFALPIDNEYKGDDLGYGDCCFLIKTDGVKAFHKIDGDDEIIFKEKYVKERIPLIYEDDYRGWNILDVSNKIDTHNMPDGAFYEKWTKTVLFKNIESAIKFILISSKYAKYNTH